MRAAAGSGTQRDLFVYGLLVYPELREALTGRRFAAQPAVLPDHTRLTIRHPAWPPIGAAVDSPGERVHGVLLSGVDSASLALLDCFEGLSEALYTRCERTVIDSHGLGGKADVYLCGSRARACLAGPWDAQAFHSAYYAHYRDVVIPEFVREYHEGGEDR